jgi:hypothetical protein
MITVTGPVVSGVNNAGRQNITFSIVDPVSANGIDGDIWFKYV